jgi:hypothetical protein
MENREIRFRGLFENGEWVYGYLYQDETGSYIKPSKKGSRFGCGLPVLPESIGQFVGIKNEFGFDIYDGDIIHSNQWKPTTYQVCYDRGAFYIAGADKHEVADIKYAEGFKVIGNIHQNSELLTENK